MYGQGTPVALAAVPAAAVGLQVGWVVSAAVTVLFVGVALWQLARRPRSNP